MRLKALSFVCLGGVLWLAYYVVGGSPKQARTDGRSPSVAESPSKAAPEMREVRGSEVRATNGTPAKPESKSKGLGDLPKAAQQRLHSAFVKAEAAFRNLELKNSKVLGKVEGEGMSGVLVMTSEPTIEQYNDFVASLASAYEGIPEDEIAVVAILRAELLAQYVQFKTQYRVLERYVREGKGNAWNSGKVTLVLRYVSTPDAVKIDGNSVTVTGAQSSERVESRAEKRYSHLFAP